VLEQDLALQRRRLEVLETRGVSCQMEIHTFSPEPYRVKKPIPITVRPHEGEFLASFLDANVNASGETEQEAFEAVKALLLDMLDQLNHQPKLGPKLATRLAVLREFIDEP
jgi:predicted RNase H-like HicB family nuclease